MHNIKEGQKGNLIIRVYDYDQWNYSYSYYDTPAEMFNFTNEEIRKGRVQIKETLLYTKEIDFFADIIKNKGTDKGEILLQIFHKNCDDPEKIKALNEKLGS